MACLPCNAACVALLDCLLWLLELILRVEIELEPEEDSEPAMQGMLRGCLLLQQDCLLVQAEDEVCLPACLPDSPPPDPCRLQLFARA